MVIALNQTDLSQKKTNDSKPRLLDQVRNRLRYLHYSIRTETAYVDWSDSIDLLDTPVN